MQIKSISVIFHLFVILVFSQTVSALPGDLDTTFGTGGKVETSIGSFDNSADMALQTDGKLIVLGETSEDGSFFDYAFVRYNSDGSLDTSFGTGGKVVIAEAEDQYAAGMALQNDGKIVAVGYDNLKLLVYRLNSNGTLDTTFATGGKFVLNLAATSVGRDVVVQPDGKIVIAGNISSTSSNSVVSVVRLNSNGTLDTTFNSVGYVSLAGSPNPSNGEAVALQSDGKIIVGGSGASGFWARLNSNGTLDGSLVLTNLSIRDIAFQNDGKIVFSGAAIAGANTYDFAVARFNPDQTIDRSFGVLGYSKISWGTVRRDIANSLFIEPDGRIIAAGLSNEGAASTATMVRLNSNGFLDIGFGNNGRVTTPYSRIDQIVRQTDGKIAAIGNISASQYSNIVAARYLVGDSNTLPNLTPFDFDGDGRADITVFRPSNATWYILRSFDNSFIGINWGLSTDTLVPEDYDGDGRTDPAVRRGNVWYSLLSSSNRYTEVTFGRAGGISVPADYDGDGKADHSDYIPFFWDYRRSSNGTVFREFYGYEGSVPLPGDFDGDGKTDVSHFYPENRVWYARYSSNSSQNDVFFGFANDIRTPADFDGDGKTDRAVFRPSNGDWYWINSSDGSFSGVHWGLNGDKPVPADYDGDGKADVAVYRPSDGTWYIYQSTQGFKAVNWGISTDIPIPNVYVR